MKCQHESRISEKVAQWLRAQHPHIIYRFDAAADINLTMPQAVRMKKLQGDTRGYPDLYIAEPRGKHHGLYIELKKDRGEVYRQDGSYRQNKHITEQVAMHAVLKSKGYAVEFGCGFDDTVAKITSYMNIGKQIEDERQSTIYSFLEQRKC